MSTFNKSVNGKTLHFAPVGVLDANNSPLLQDEIDESHEGMTEVVFDLADLTYTLALACVCCWQHRRTWGARGTCA